MSDSIFGLDACRRAINALPAGSHASISHARNVSSRIQRVAMVSKKSVNRADWGHISRLYLLVSRRFSADERIGKFYSKCRSDLLSQQTATIEIPSPGS